MGHYISHKALHTNRMVGATKDFTRRFNCLHNLFVEPLVFLLTLHLKHGLVKNLCENYGRTVANIVQRQM